VQGRRKRGKKRKTKITKMKILLLWDRMGDYHRARWKALANIIGNKNCHAADLGKGDKLYKWSNTEKNSQYHLLSEKPVEEVKPFEALTAYKKIIRENSITHVCIPGYGRLAYILMLIWSRINGIKVLMFAESWYPGNTITDKLKGLLIKYTTNISFVSGKRAKEHFIKRLKYPEQKIIEGYSTIDNKHFASSTVEKTKPPQLLCVARFAPEKNLPMLIEAFQGSHLSKSWRLKIVGGGPQKELLKNMIGKSNIELTDWLKYDKLPDLYASSSCFILPSIFEPWGLVVNEAMAAGLPVILSNEVGAIPDLLEKDNNGWSFDAKNKKELINILNKLNNLSSDKIQKMGERSEEIISDFTTEIWAEKIVKAFNSKTK
jgi:glycosyltransferase involved in cell wall biosynthesis